MWINQWGGRGRGGLNKKILLDYAQSSMRYFRSQVTRKNRFLKTDAHRWGGRVFFNKTILLEYTMSAMSYAAGELESLKPLQKSVEPGKKIQKVKKYSPGNFY